MDAPIGRLRRRREFLRVARGRRKWAAPGLVLQAREAAGDRDKAREAADNRDKAREAAGDSDKTHDANCDDAEVRIGFTASRKIGNAVARNRAKRRLRAAVNEVMPACAAPGIDYVIIARGATLTRCYADLLADLKTALRRVGALRSESSRS
ncbi:MAG: ribonuclease P protein component [Alphaproteobacteria bacterium]|nr:ribonuclease P protein component [Alphaproteobacteria bacterium]